MFSEQDKDRIERTRKRAERDSSGRVMLMVKSHSDRYDLYRLLATVGFLLVVSALVYIVTMISPAQDAPVQASQWLWWLQFPLALVGWWLAGRKAVLASVTPVGVQAQMAANAGQIAFSSLNNGGSTTPTVFIFIAELERQVQIYTNAAVHAEVGTAVWPRHIDTLVHAMRSQRAVDGLCEVLEAIGAQLAVSFPKTDENMSDSLAKQFRHGV